MTTSLADFRRGDTVRIKLTYPAGTNLAGFQWWFTLKANMDDLDQDAVLQVHKQTDDYSGDNFAGGVAYIVLPAVLTGDVTPGKYHYDIQEKAASGEIRTLLPPLASANEKISVITDVTRTTT